MTEKDKIKNQILEFKNCMQGILFTLYLQDVISEIEIKCLEAIVMNVTIDYNDILHENLNLLDSCIYSLKKENKIRKNLHDFMTEKIKDIRGIIKKGCKENKNESEKEDTVFSIKELRDEITNVILKYNESNNTKINHLAMYDDHSGIYCNAEYKILIYEGLYEKGEDFGRKK